MQRINTIVQKITDLTKQEEKTVIDIDLMLDYTRVLYADLLEWRSKIAFNNSLVPPAEKAAPAAPVKKEEPKATPVPPVAPAPLPPVHEQKVATPASTPLPTGAVASHATAEKIAPPAEERDIRHLIGINDKYLFISELFGNNKDSYEEALQYINACAALQQARQWIDGQMYKHYWNDESEAVQSFYNMLELFFSEK